MQLKQIRRVTVKDMDKWLLINKKFSAIWPNISKKEPMKEHENIEILKINMKNIFLKNLQNN